MAIIEKGVEKNVGTGSSLSARSATTSPASAWRDSFTGSLAGLVSGVVCAAALCMAPIAAQARQAPGLGEPVALSSLPREAQQTEQ